jgi:arylformamidase
MNFSSIRHFTLALLTTTLVSTAHAGPLRDWLAEHKAERQAAQETSALDDGESSGKAVQVQGMRVLKDVAYGNENEQKMDVYLPAHAAGAPVIFMVHGGAWRIGDKAASQVVKNKVARWVSKGFIFVSVNYRLLPKADPLMQADDVARALAAAQAKAASWGGDPAKFVLMGHSAGAHLVALLSAAPARAQALGARPWLGTVSLDSAAMDVVQVMERDHFRLYDQAFGKDAAYWQASSPLRVLTSSAPPMLLVCSSKRPDKPCDQAKVFAAKAATLGIRAEISEQAMSHKEINQKLGLPGSYTDAVEIFMGSLDGAIRKLLAEAGNHAQQ